MTARYIGIDFGTSSTVVYVKDVQDNGIDGQLPQPVLADGSPVIPSVAFVIDNNFECPENFIFGQNAVVSQIDGVLYRNFKLSLVSQDDEIVHRAKQLVSGFFKWLKTCYNDQRLYMGTCGYEETFVSYPVKWPEDIREFMKTAAIEAGFQNVHGMDEASAAIQGLLYSNLDTLQRYGILKRNQQLKVMLLDMGAGTSDLVFGIFDTSEKKLKVVGTYPEASNDVYYGGREFDEAIYDFIGSYLQENGIHYDGATERERLLFDCKCWKENTLSPCLGKNQPITKLPPFVMMLTTHLGENRTPFPVIGRNLFEEEFAEHIGLFAAFIEDAIAKITAREPTIDFGSETDMVILTGGHSQWYFVRELLLGKMVTAAGRECLFPKIRANPERLLQLPRPSETVALGLVNSKEGLNLAETSDYNIWFRAVIGDEECPPLLIVKKNELLPYTNNEIVYTEALNCSQHVLTSCDLDFDFFIEYSILVSRDSLENARPYKDEIRIACKDSRTRLKYRKTEFAAIAKGRKVFPISDQVTIAVRFSMTETQDIELQGLVFGNRHEDKRFHKRLAFNKGGSANAI